MTERLWSNALAARRQNALTQNVGWSQVGFVNNLRRAGYVLWCKLLTIRDEQNHFFNQILSTLYIGGWAAEGELVASGENFYLRKRILEGLEKLVVSAEQDQHRDLSYVYLNP